MEIAVAIMQMIENSLTYFEPNPKNVKLIKYYSEDGKNINVTIINFQDKEILNVNVERDDNISTLYPEYSEFFEKIYDQEFM